MQINNKIVNMQRRGRKDVNDETHVSLQSEHGTGASSSTVGDESVLSSIFSKKNQRCSLEHQNFEIFEENNSPNNSCESSDNFDSTTIGLDDSFLDEADLRTIDYLVSNVSYKLGKEYQKSMKLHANHSSTLKTSNKRQRVFTEVEAKYHDEVGSCVESMVDDCAEEQHQVTSDFKEVLMANTQNPANFTSISRTSEISMSHRSNDSAAAHHEIPETSNPVFSNQLNLSIENVSNQEESGTFFGLPSTVQTLVHDFKGIEKLYDWQKECLNLEAIRRKKNFIYSLPTSGGKTLVAEILILREILCSKKNSIFILPYVSIVQEKVRSLSPFALALGFLVEEYAGGKGRYPPRRRRWKNVVYVATIEKALGLVNSLVETRRLSELGLVVVDELHMVGENGRGALLEALLTRLMFADSSIQTIGMSATIGNLSDLSQFLSAETYTQDFRPVELKEYLKVGNEILLIDVANEQIFQQDRKLPAVRADHWDPDQIGFLVSEVVPANSCLVFCPTKKNCENVALVVCRALGRDVLKHQQAEKRALFHALVVEGSGSVCPTLKKTLPMGVAYHHSGLTMNERNLLEEGYRAGVLCCLCCTSTLAAGVNLPAKRVILRSPKVGLAFLSLSQYKQMVGRAGRAGIDARGESIMVCQEDEVSRVRQLLSSGMNQCISQLHECDGIYLEQLVLSSVGLGQASTRGEIKRLVRLSLLGVQAERLEVELGPIVDDIITSLFQSKVLLLAEPPSSVPVSRKSTSSQLVSTAIITNDSKLCISSLGKAAMKGNLTMAQAQTLQKDLVLAQGGLNLLTPLHLLFLVTPPEAADTIRFSPIVLAEVYRGLPAEDQMTVRLVGISEGMVATMMSGEIPKAVSDSLPRRVYVSLLLREMWQGGSVWDVAHKFDQPRGNVQALMASASAYTANVQNFCLELHESFWCFSALLSKLSERLAHCCSLELLPLMELPAIKKGRARQLFDAGFKTLQALSAADPQDLVLKVKHLPAKVARHIVSTANMLLLERAESLREEAEELMEGTRQALPQNLNVSLTQALPPSPSQRPPHTLAPSPSQMPAPHPSWLDPVGSQMNLNRSTCLNQSFSPR